MRRRRFEVWRDEPPGEQLNDFVLVALAPIDAFDGTIVRSKRLDARIEGMPRPVRNLSGLLVFVHRFQPKSDDGPVELPEYTIRIFAEGAGYFNPEDITFNPPAWNTATWAVDRLRTVPLFRRPNFPLDGYVTVVGGVVKHGGEAAEGARVTAEIPPSVLPPGPAPDQFETRTDEFGAFRLPLRLPDVVPPASWTDMKFHFRADPAAVDPDRTLTDGKVFSGRSHAFDKAIHLDSIETPELILLGS